MRPVGSAEVAAFPVRVDRAHEIEVLRHRLFRPARCGLKSFVACEVHVHACCAAVEQGPQHRESLVDFDATGLALPRVTDHDESLITEVKYLLGIYVFGGEALRPGIEKLE